MMYEPESWTSRIVALCLGLLLAAIALNLTVALLEPILPWLITIVIGAALVWLGVVSYRLRRRREP